MSDTNFDLDKQAREQWAAWLQAALERRGSSQKAIAIEIDQEDGSSARSDVSRFVTGKEGALRAWFTVHLNRLDLLARHAGLSVDELRAKLAALQRGELEPEVAWHPAFPELRLEDVEIPAALEGERGETLERVLEQFIARLGEPQRWTSSVKGEKLGIIGDPGRTRDIAVRQVREALRARLDAIRADAVAKVPDAPHLSIEVVVAPAAAEPAPGFLRILVMNEGQARETANLVPWRLRCLAWGPAQAMALARRLRSALPAGPAREVERFAEKVEATPAMVGAEGAPDLIIRLLGAVARRGCPSAVPEARDLVASAAWEQALVRGGEALKPFDEGLMDRLMSDLVRRTRTRPDDVRAWTLAPRPVVLEALRDALRALLGPAAGRPLTALVAELKQAKGAARQAAIDALERALASEPADAILEALVRGGLFTEERRYTGVFLRVAEPAVAAIWAARGLGELPPFDPDWQRLLDPDWLVVLDELGRRGLRAETLAARLADCPAELCLDAAAMAVRHALAAVEHVAPDVLVPAWATLIWAQAHGMYSSMFAWSDGPWGAWAKRALREVSRRYRDSLPTFDRDPVEELARHVPEPVLALVARWRATPDVAERSREQIQHWGFFAWVDLRDRDQLRHLICELCPDQVVPTAPWSLDWWERQDLGRGLVRLVERARGGDDRALRLLDGRAWLEERAERIALDLDAIRRGQAAQLADRLWHHLPASGVLSWVAQAGHTGEDAAILLHQFAHWLKPVERSAQIEPLLALARAADPAEMERLCARSLVMDLRWHRPLDPTLALAIAERVGLRKLLRAIVARPARLLTRSRLRVREGRVVVEPTEEWTPLVGVVVLGEPHRPHGARVELDEAVEAMEEQAHAAAVALYRLGERDALRARWQIGPDYLDGLALWRDLARAEGLYSLVVCGFPSPYHRLDSLLALGELEGDPYKRESFLPAMHQREHGAYPARPALLDDLDQMAPMLRPEVLSIGRGVRILLQDLPEVLSDEIEAILLTGPFAQHQHRAAGLGHQIGGWRDRAATALLDLGDDGPLRVWAQVDGGLHASTEHEQETAHVVQRWLDADRARLDRAWTLVQSEARAGRLSEERRREAEDRLLHEGSATAWREPLASEVSKPVDPRPYVIAFALSTDDHGRWTSLHHQNRHHRDWLPVIRQRIRQVDETRTRAALAVELSAHVPNPHELERELRRWATEDPDPFLGGPRFDWRCARAVGGYEVLLERLVRLDRPWVAEALVRLWGLALRLPIRGNRPRYETYSWTEDRPPEPMVLVPSGFGTCPSPLAELARHLEAHGRTGQLLQAWASPPLDPAPELEGDRDRSWWIRAWLRPWWLRLADDEALLVELRRDPVRFPMDVVDELIRRRSPGLEAFSAHLARVTDHFVVRPLLEIDPGAAVQVVRERVIEPVAPIRMELASAMDDAASRWFQHLGVQRALRAAVASLVRGDAAG